MAQRKDPDVPARTPGEAEEAPRKDAGEMGEASGRQQALDPREEEGWSQPESSAQKGAPPDPDLPQ